MVLLNFAGVREAESFTIFKEGYVIAKCTKATEGTTDDGTPIWAMEYTVQSGQYKGEIIKDTVYLAAKDNDEKKIKNLLSKIKRMYSRILGTVLEGSRECKPTEFLNSLVMLKMVQRTYENKQKETKWTSQIDFAGFFAPSDYVGTMDEEMAHSEGYLKSLESTEVSTAGASSAKKVAGF